MAKDCDKLCPNGERCYLTLGTWMTVPKMFNPKPTKKYFWPGNPTRCSHDCISEQYDKVFGEKHGVS